MLPGNFVKINLLRHLEPSWAVAPGHRLELRTLALEEGKWSSCLPRHVIDGDMEAFLSPEDCPKAQVRVEAGKGLQRPWSEHHFRACPPQGLLARVYKQSRALTSHWSDHIY